MAPPKKGRLYLDLYARESAFRMVDGEEKYHWALVYGDPEGHYGVRFHAKDELTSHGWVWKFEELCICLTSADMVLVRIVIGIVPDVNSLFEGLRSVPVGSGPLFDCEDLVEMAYELVGRDSKALGTRVVGWHRIRKAAMEYCQAKRDEKRFDISFPGDKSKVPTWDMLTRKELFP